MASLLMLVLVAVTSAGAYALAVRRWGLTPRQLPMALRSLAEGVGLGAGFLIVNLAVGFLLAKILGTIQVLETNLGTVVSVYALDDSTLVALSALQGMALRWWIGRT